eukprot:1561881-Alexandrium_andersonii.AAC.1
MARSTRLMSQLGEATIHSAVTPPPSVASNSCSIFSSPKQATMRVPGASERSHSSGVPSTSMLREGERAEG